MFALLLSILVLFAYRLNLQQRSRRSPMFTIQAYNETLRCAWASRIQANGESLLGVQTIRNASFGATFFANTAILLMMGTLTLSTQTDKIQAFSHTLPNMIAHASLVSTKIILLLSLFFIAFICFAQSIRFFSHISFMLGLPAHACPLRDITTHLNHGWAYHSLGMKAYYYAIPFAFGLFSDLLMVMSSIALVGFMYQLDRAPHQFGEILPQA